MGNQISELTAQQTVLTNQANAALEIIAFIDSGADIPQLIAPAGFSLTPGNTQVTIEWDNDRYATNYVIQRSTTVGDFGHAVVVYNDVWTATFVDVSLVNGTLYYYRIKSQAPGFLDSDYSTSSTTPHS